MSPYTDNKDWTPLVTGFVASSEPYVISYSKDISTEQPMFIKDIPYFPIGGEITCSMSSCLSMLLSYNNISADPVETSEIFSSCFMSEDFRKWYNCEISEERKELGEMIACAQYMISSKYKSLRGGVFRTEVPKVRLAFIKRDIPVILTCQFPMPDGQISTSILVKGWVDDYLIVNDPRGNALTMYKDRYGENLLYPIDFVDKHVNKVSWNEVAVIRIL